MRMRYVNERWLVGLAFFACVLSSESMAQNRVDECGTLVSGVECVLFRTDDGRRFILDDLGRFEVGDAVRVLAERVDNAVSFCQEGDGFLAVLSISYCDGEVTACGALVQGAECVLFEDDRGFLFAIDEIGSFTTGDRVRVRGVFDGDCVTTCQQTTGCIRSNTIEAAPSAGPCDDAPGSIVCGASGLSLIGLTLAGLIRCRR